MSTARCEPIAPDPSDPAKPGGKKFSIRTDFYYDATVATVAASRVVVSDVVGNRDGEEGVREPSAASRKHVVDSMREPPAAQDRRDEDEPHRRGDAAIQIASLPPASHASASKGGHPFALSSHAPVGLVHRHADSGAQSSIALTSPPSSSTLVGTGDPQRRQLPLSPSGYLPAGKGERKRTVSTLSPSGESKRQKASREPSAAMLDRCELHRETNRPRFVEACCGPQSVLSQPQNMAKDFICTRITEADDFTTREGQQIALDRLRGPGDVLWYSAPCTGGCSFQRINLARGNDSTIEKITAHRLLFRRLWNAFERVATIAMKRGATIVVEWPKSCQYWNDTQVKRFLHTRGFASAIVHGCVVGMTSVRSSMNGALVRKQWRLATNDPALASLLSKECHGDHHHIPVEGADVKKSEDYTPGFAEHACEAIRLRKSAVVGGSRC